MTLFIADIASYQQGLSLAEIRAAGYGGINLKISHGDGQRAVHPDVKTFAADTSMRHSTFHWLTGDASGAAQASYAYARMSELGLTRAPHTVDVEAGKEAVGGEPTEAIYREYLKIMTQLLKRPIITYSGDWYAESRPWLRASAESPWLWSAPTVGYLPAYPGDEDAAWENGYGGWVALAVMQYRVSAVGGIALSQSACRSERLWQAMGGIDMSWSNIPASLSLRDELNAAFPARDKASDGFIGDTSHSAGSSDHNPDETGNTPYEDSDSIDEVHAFDADSDLKQAGWTMTRVCNIIVARCRSGAEKRLRYIIWDRKIISASWGWSEWRDYTGASPHTEHAHFSFLYGSGAAPGNPEQITTPWGILAAVEEEDVALDAADKSFITAEVAKAVKAATDARAALTAEVNNVPAEVFAFKYGDRAFPNRTLTTLAGDLAQLRDYEVGGGNPDGTGALVPRAGTYLALTAGVSGQVSSLSEQLNGDVEAVAAALMPGLAQLIIAALPAGALTPEQVEQAVRNVLTNGVG